MLVLGLTCCFTSLDNDFLPELPRWFGHDSAAALVEDGNVIAAVEEERLNRLKHTNRFAAESVRSCLDQAGLSIGDVDRIAYFFEEEDTDKELNILYAENPTARLRYSRELIAANLSATFGTHVDESIIRFVHHHTTHAYAAYFQSGFEDSLVAVIDGSGERESVSLLSAQGQDMRLIRSFPPSKSLGHLYSTSIELLGYSLFDEYKVMGLAPHGDPARYRGVFESLYELTGDGGYEMEYSRFRSRFLLDGFRPRRKGEPFTQEHKDFAASLQETLESIGTHIISACQDQTGQRRLSIAGGVGLNCTMNGKLLASGRFDDLFVHPASHDAGAAIGAAMYVCHTESPRSFKPDVLDHVYWGPPVGTAAEVRRTLTGWDAFLEVRTSEDICAETAALLADGAVVGWVQGRSEFGPRALGNRSILADPRPEANRVRINDVVKKREGYRPFAPSVLAEEASTYFDVPAGAPPLEYMVVIVDVRPEHRASLGAVTHVDGTARIQAVNRSTNPMYWSLIRAFGDITGVPVLLNTSFNNHAEPIVQTTADAIECFLTTRLNYLVVDSFLVRKRQPPETAYLNLVPVLHPTANLRMTASRGGPGQPLQQGHEVYFRDAGVGRADISASLFAILMEVDGVRTLAELGLEGQPLLDEVVMLWERRFLRLRPASAAG